MVTSKITSVIKKAERLNTSFNLLLTCGISLELSFLDAKDFQPKAGMRAEATFLNYIPMMLTIDGNVMFSRSKTDVFYEMRHLLSALETEIQAEKIEQGRLEFLSAGHFSAPDTAVAICNRQPVYPRGMERRALRNGAGTENSYRHRVSI